MAILRLNYHLKTRVKILSTTNHIKRGDIYTMEILDEWHSMSQMGHHTRFYALANTTLNPNQYEHIIVVWTFLL